MIISSKKVRSNMIHDTHILRLRKLNQSPLLNFKYLWVFATYLSICNTYSSHLCIYTQHKAFFYDFHRSSINVTKVSYWIYDLWRTIEEVHLHLLLTDYSPYKKKLNYHKLYDILFCSNITEDVISTKKRSLK